MEVAEDTSVTARCWERSKRRNRGYSSGDAYIQLHKRIIEIICPRFEDRIFRDHSPTKIISKSPVPGERLYGVGPI